MNIGELFITLGIKGSDKTIGALTGVEKGLKDTASMSLEAKAAIIGAMYALERLFAVSGQRGTDLTNLNSVLGVSAKTLQQYEYAARQVGMSNQELDGSFKTLQSTMTKTLMGEGTPKGFARVAQLTGDMTPKDIEQFARQPQLLMQKLQEYAQKETNVGLRNEVLKSFGLGDNMIAALNRQAFRPEILSKAPTYGDPEIEQLDKANIAWSNLGTTIQMAIGHFNAAHGGKLVEDISMITDKVLGLSEAFIKLAEKLKIFEVIGQVFEGWEKIFNGVSSGVDKLNNKKDWGGEDNKEGSVLGTLSEGATAFFNGFLEGAEKPSGAHKAHPAPKSILDKTSIAPSPAPIQNQGADSTQNINVNQSLIFQHDGKDATKTGDSVKKAVKDAFRQTSAQAQGT